MNIMNAKVTTDYVLLCQNKGTSKMSWQLFLDDGTCHTVYF